MDKVRILFLAANPKDTPQLRLTEEIQLITDKIRAAEFRDSFELISHWGTQPGDLLQTLLEHKPHIVHFSGHGSSSGELILLDKDGNMKPVSKEAIESLFTNLHGNIRLVLLNACYAQPQAQAIAQAVGCAIGTNKAIGDEAAIVFASSFYQAFAFEQSIQSAFKLAQTALMLQGIPEENTPQLLVGGGADASAIFPITLLVGAAGVTDAGRKKAEEPAKEVDRIELVVNLSGLAPPSFSTVITLIPGAAK